MEIYKYSLNDINEIVDSSKRAHDLKLFLIELKSMGLNADDIDKNKSLEMLINGILEKEALMEYYDDIIGDDSSQYSFYPHIRQHQ